MRLLDLPEIDDGLRDYQKNGKHNIYQAWESCRTVLFQMPTGTGKTRLFSSIIRDTQRQAQQEHCRKGVLVLAHRTELIEQIDQTLSFKYGIAHGIVKSGYEEQMHYPVQVASVQTIVRRLDRWTTKGFSYIIIDEAHHAVSPTYLKICKQFPEAKVLGVTATPCRLSGDALRKLFGSLVLSQPVSKFIQQGYLSPYQYYSIKPESQIQRELDSISHFNIEGDYADADMMRICDTNKVRANIIQAYLDYAKGKKGIIYTINQEHNKHICEEFKKIGVRIKAIDSKTPADERKKTVADFRAGKIDVICNVNIFSEGFDCPDCEFIQLARPTCSLAMYLQQVGRGLRPHERKAQAVILDNVGSYNKFGLPSANRKWRFHFEGSGQRVTKSVQRSVLTVGRSKQEIKEGDEDMVMIFDGGAELNAFGGKEVDSVLESIVNTREWFPFGAISMLDEVDAMSLSIIDAFCEYKAQDMDEWTDSVEDGLYTNMATVDDSKEIEQIEDDIYRTFRFLHKGKYGVCELKCNPKILEKALNQYSEGLIKEEDIYGILLPPVYDEIGVPDNSDRYVCKKEGKYGVICGKSRNTIVPFDYKELEVQTNGMFLANKNEKIGLISGEEVIIPFEYEEILDVHLSIRDCYYAIREGDRYRMRLFDGKTFMGEEERLSVKSHLVDHIYLGICRKKFAFLCDSDGKVLFPFYFSRIGLIQIKDKWEIVFATKKSAVLLDRNLDIVKEFDECPEADSEFIKKFHIDRFFVKKSDRKEIEEKYTKAQPMPVAKEALKQKETEEEVSTGRVFKSEDGLYGYILKDKILLEPVYESIEPYKQGRLIVTKDGKKGVYAIIGKQAKLVAPLIFSALEGTGKKLKYKVNNDQALSEFLLSHVKFQRGDYLVIMAEEGYEYIRYQGTRIITYKEIRYIGRGVFIVQNNNSRYGLIRCEGLKVKILRSVKYSNIEIASDGDSILLHGETGRPRYVSLRAIAQE